MGTFSVNFAVLVALPSLLGMVQVWLTTNSRVIALLKQTQASQGTPENHTTCSTHMSIPPPVNTVVAPVAMVEAHEMDYEGGDEDAGAEMVAIVTQQSQVEQPATVTMFVSGTLVVNVILIIPLGRPCKCPQYTIL